MVGCSAIVSFIKHLEFSQNKESFGAVFTRSEEVGFVGATKLAEEWPFISDSCFVSIETSVPVGDSLMGKGPICRVGDRITIFDNHATESILLTGKKYGIPVQRALLDGGACEAAAISAFGIKVDIFFTSYPSNEACNAQIGSISVILTMDPAPLNDAAVPFPTSP